MPYIVKYDDIANLLFASNAKFGEWNDSFASITQSLQSFTTMDSFKGQTATNVKTYISEVHFTILLSISEILAEYQSRYLLYKDGWHQQVDNHLHSDLQEETLVNLKTFFKQSCIDFTDQHEEAQRIASSISDLISASFPHASAVERDYSTSSYRISSLLENAGDYEYKHYSSDFTHLDTMISALNSFLAEMLAADKSYIVTFAPGTLQSAASIPALANAVNTAYADRISLSDALSAAYESEQLRFSQLEAEWAKQREEEGWLTLAISALVVVGGVVCIVATAGLATPLVVAGAVAGSATIVYGASNMWESGENIYYGMNGDYSTAAFNPLRDTVFGGDQASYDIFGTVCVLSSSVLTLGAGAISSAGAAAQAGTSTVRAVTTFGAKTAFTMGAGFAGGWVGESVALELGASDSMAKLTGLLSGTGFGMVAGVGAQAVDQRYNLSGFYGPQKITNPDFVKNPNDPPENWEADFNKHAPGGGYVLDADGKPIVKFIEEDGIFKPGATLKRVGDAEGRYTTVIGQDGSSASYGQVSLPYAENPNAVSNQRIVRDFSELPNAVKNLPEGPLKNEITQTVNTYFNRDVNNLKVKYGQIAPAFNQPGGAVQFELPLKISTLQNLGFLKDTTPLFPISPATFPAAAGGAAGATK